jgi:hypothetical protein
VSSVARSVVIAHERRGLIWASSSRGAKETVALGWPDDCVLEAQLCGKDLIRQLSV